MKTDPNDARARADGLLATIGELEARIGAHSGHLAAQIKSIQQTAAQVIDPLQQALEMAVKELMALMKTDTLALFDGADKIALDHGALLHSRQPRVTIPRDAVGKIKDMGWVEALKIVETVNREVVEAWSDEQLFAIGAARKLVDRFAYETLSAPRAGSRKKGAAR
jgi:hypothetical protein